MKTLARPVRFLWRNFVRGNDRADTATWLALWGLVIYWAVAACALPLWIYIVTGIGAAVVQGVLTRIDPAGFGRKYRNG